MYVQHARASASQHPRRSHRPKQWPTMLCCCCHDVASAAATAALRLLPRPVAMFAMRLLLRDAALPPAVLPRRPQNKYSPIFTNSYLLMQQRPAYLRASTSAPPQRPSYSSAYTSDPQLPRPCGEHGPLFGPSDLVNDALRLGVLYSYNGKSTRHSRVLFGVLPGRHLFKPCCWTLNTSAILNKG